MKLQANPWKWQADNNKSTPKKEENSFERQYKKNNEDAYIRL